MFFHHGCCCYSTISPWREGLPSLTGWSNTSRCSPGGHQITYSSAKNDGSSMLVRCCLYLGLSSIFGRDCLFFANSNLGLLDEWALRGHTPRANSNISARINRACLDTMPATARNEQNAKM